MEMRKSKLLFPEHMCFANVITEQSRLLTKSNFQKDFYFSFKGRCEISQIQAYEGGNGSKITFSSRILFLI